MKGWHLARFETDRPELKNVPHPKNCDTIKHSYLQKCHWPSASIARASMIKADSEKEVLDALCHAFEMEAEKIELYSEVSAKLEELQALSLQVIIDREVKDELQHARRLANRIKTLGGALPSIEQLARTQHLKRSSSASEDVFTMIRNIISAEETAIRYYRHLVTISEENDAETHSLAVELFKDENRHRGEIEGFVGGKPTKASPTKNRVRIGAFEQEKVA